jgi:effector-binding domain-containing protein
MEAAMNHSTVTSHEVGRHLAVTSFPWSQEDVAERMSAAFSTVVGYLARAGVRITGPAVGYYERHPEGSTVSAGFVVDEVIEGDETVRSLTLPAGDVLTTVHVGPYTKLTETYAALQEHAAVNHLVLDQHVMWEEYLSQPDVEPDLVMTRVTWPVTHANLGAPLRRTADVTG